MAINAGKMTERIIIQKRTITFEKGVKKDNWNEDNPYYSCWAEFLDLYGQEKYSAYSVNLENSIKFKCRTCNALKVLIKNTREDNIKDFRVIWNNEAYDLVFVDSMNNSKTEIILQVKKVS